jgi:starch synthase
LAKTAKIKPLKILIAASEVVPFAKTGGLADVTGALPKALRALGHDVRVVMPKYKKIDDAKFSVVDTGKSVNVNIALVDHAGAIKETVIPGTDVPVYMIDNTEFFYRDEIYRTSTGEYWDNAERFLFFSKAVLEMLKELDWQPDVINCNDWHTGLIPVFLKTTYAADPFYAPIATAYSIHNIAYQGFFPKEIMSHAGLPWEIFNMHQLEFYGGVNYMKGGIVFSDVVNTVSRRYKEEIETPEFGYNLDGVLRERRESLFGILNGIDYDLWNPATDNCLPVNYDIDTVEKKVEVKKKLLETLGLKYYENVPVVGLVSRFDDQKGLDNISKIMEEMMRLNMQFVVLGTGEERYHEMFRYWAGVFPEKLSASIKFDNTLAHMIYAGSDMFLMPSYFEPCGLGQLIALKYGTVPVVRETGGLADTVKCYNFKEKKGNGFSYAGYYATDLFNTIRVAVDTFKNQQVWKKIQNNGMKEDFSWEHSAERYVDLYNNALQKKAK